MLAKKELSKTQFPGMYFKSTVSILIGLSFCVMQMQAQIVDITDQKTMGGSLSEGAYNLDATSDGGLIAAGYTYSGISGIKTDGNYGNSDYWVVKTDAAGNIEWQKTYGGSDYDQLETVAQTLDGGYILGGYSVSGISGIKTENNHASSIDIWIIKLDATGNIVWQNTIGGNSSDYLGSIENTSDGGYIVGAYSYSDISGDKTENHVGDADYWILKLNAAGNIVWQNTIGGTSADYCFRAQEISGGGFIVSGSSASPVSGDKTEGTVGPGFSTDIWVLKLDASGNIVWQNTIGGNSTETTFELELTPDGGAVIGTYTLSMASGDKSENNISGAPTTYDYWVVKVNSSGIVEWENTIGGTGDDYCHGLTQTSDGGFAVSGYSTSPASGDKTENMFGVADYWVVKLDSLGNIIWDKNIGGALSDYCYDIIELNDGQLVLGGISTSGITGNKTVGTYGNGDFWLVYLNECVPTDEICNSLDDNCNGLIDDGITVEISIAADGPTTICQGNTVVLTATHTGSTLQWKKNGVNIPGATASTYTTGIKGTYSCVASSDCDADTSANIVVVVNKNPSASISAGGPTSFCAGGSVTLTETPSGGCTYQWYKGAAPIAGATGLSYVATTAGNYKCRVTKAATGCFKNSNSIAVFITCKEGEELTDNSNLLVYPNPAHQFIDVKINSANAEQTVIVICDAAGKNVLVQQCLNNEITIDISGLTPGVYFIQSSSTSQLNNSIFIKQ